MVVRYLIATGVATVIAFGLFFLMQSLIAMSGLDDDKVYAHRVIDFVRLKRAEATAEKKRELPQKQAPQNNPAPPPMTMPSGGGEGAMHDAIAVEAPSVDTNLDISGGPSLGAAPSDTSEIPLVRVQPQYPRQAAQQKVEGWVQVQFTISVTGAVKDPHVVKSHPPGVFDRAAIRAIRKWKYKPKIDEGKAVETRNVRVQLTFELQDEE